jgi:hypothetical protein
MTDRVSDLLQEARREAYRAELKASNGRYPAAAWHMINVEDLVDEASSEIVEAGMEADL